MIIGAVYRVSWVEQRGSLLGVSSALLRFRGESAGALIFDFTGRRRTIGMSPLLMMGAELAEAHR